MKYLVRIETACGNVVEFFRHGEKLLDTVIKQEKRFFQDQKNGTLFKDCYLKGNKICIYRTNYEATPQNKVFEEDMKKFCEVGRC